MPANTTDDESTYINRRPTQRPVQAVLGGGFDHFTQRGFKFSLLRNIVHARPTAQCGAGKVPVHVTPTGARSIEHRWVKILFGLAKEAQSLPRIACAESLALIAQ